MRTKREGISFNVRTNFFRVVVTARRENFLRRQIVVLERHSNGCLTSATEVRLTDLGNLPEDAMRSASQSETSTP